MPWTVDPSLETPPSRQLVEAVLDAVATGRFLPGDALPSVRRMAAMALVNPNTVARAYRDLEHLGVTRGSNGRGVFVTGDGPRLARAQRQDATLLAFTRAAQEALRSGHPAARLHATLDELTREQVP